MLQWILSQRSDKVKSTERIKWVPWAIDSEQPDMFSWVTSQMSITQYLKVIGDECDWFNSVVVLSSLAPSSAIFWQVIDWILFSQRTKNVILSPPDSTCLANPALHFQHRRRAVIWWLDHELTGQFTMLNQLMKEAILANDIKLLEWFFELHLPSNHWENALYLESEFNPDLEYRSILPSLKWIEETKQLNFRDGDADVVVDNLLWTCEFIGDVASIRWLEKRQGDTLYWYATRQENGMLLIEVLLRWIHAPGSAHSLMDSLDDVRWLLYRFPDHLEFPEGAIVNMRNMFETELKSRMHKDGHELCPRCMSGDMALSEKIHMAAEKLEALLRARNAWLVT
jgi:hypothetical protein